LFLDEAFIITTIDLFEAGAETTNNTLEFAFYYMINNPRVQIKVQAEIDRVVGRNRLVSSLDRADMTYTVAVLLEVQRISNVVPMTVRAPTEDYWLDGYLIEKVKVFFIFWQKYAFLNCMFMQFFRVASVSLICLVCTWTTIFGVIPV
jgi:cytochrome P450